MRDYLREMQEMPRQHKFFIGFDSDGCVFDTMEIKQKECFCPAFIKHFKMQAASRYAREVWEFVNLYSKTRGCNRFLAVVAAINFIRERADILRRGVEVYDIAELETWIKQESKLGNPALATYMKSHDTAALRQLMAWSIEVNERITDMVYGIPPFPGVVELLKTAQGRADMIVVSQTPLEALTREWAENKIDSYLTMICGQEHGTKTEHLKFTAVGHYDADKILMVGDAPGDYKAAQKNSALFFPIVPGREEASWAEFNREGLDRFFNGTYAGEYQAKLLAEFDASLPEHPSWK